MVTMATGSTITQNHFPDFLLPAKEVRNKNNESRYFHLNEDNDSNLLSKAVQHAEKQIIKDVLKRAKNKSIAIKILGTSRNILLKTEAVQLRVNAWLIHFMNRFKLKNSSENQHQGVGTLYADNIKVLRQKIAHEAW